MPKLTVNDTQILEISAGKRLVNALIDDAGADQHYSCGGQARCTTCRVQFVAGEPVRITAAEKALLAAKGIDTQFPGVRLSCQINCDEDMSVHILVPKPADKNPNHPAPDIEPAPIWTTK